MSFETEKPPLDSMQAMGPTEPTELEAQLSLPWTEAIEDLKGLEPGTIVTGFENLDQVDIFVDNLGKSLKGAYHPSTRFLEPYILGARGKKVYGGWNSRTNPPSKTFQTKGFYGTFVNLQAVMLEDTVPEESQFAARRFILSGDMHSSGTGFRGRASKLYEVGNLAVPNPYYKGETVIRGPIYVRAVNIKGNNADKIAEEINAQSARMANAVVLRGLRHVFSAGLPGHGKR